MIFSDSVWQVLNFFWKENIIFEGILSIHFFVNTSCSVPTKIIGYGVFFPWAYRNF